MSRQSPKVAIILVNWNGREDTLECLDSIGKIDYPNFAVILVDNGSSDGSVMAIREQFAGQEIIETGANLGFTGGNNVGISHALGHGAEYILLLNNDTIVDPQLLNSFLAVSRAKKDVGIFGAKIYYYARPDVIWYAGARWRKEIQRFLHIGLRCIDDGKEFNDVAETDYVCGCALFAPAEIFETVGPFDERFFLTFEDADLCYRARKFGYKSYFVPDAKVWHKVSRSFGGVGSPLFTYFMTRNRLLWTEMHLPFLSRLDIYKHVLGEVLRYILPPRLGSIEQLHARFVPEPGGYFSVYNKAMLRKYHNPLNRVRLLGVRDYLIRRFGDCPASVRLLLGRRSGS